MEIQYYVAAPLLIYLCMATRRRYGRGMALLYCAAVGLLSWAVQRLAPNENTAHYHTVGRVWQFLTGTAAHLLTSTTPATNGGGGGTPLDVLPGGNASTVTEKIANGKHYAPLSVEGSGGGDGEGEEEQCLLPATNQMCNGGSGGDDLCTEPKQARRHLNPLLHTAIFLSAHALLLFNNVGLVAYSVGVGESWRMEVYREVATLLSLVIIWFGPTGATRGENPAMAAGWDGVGWWGLEQVVSKPLVWFGDISYSLYLIHWPLITFTKYFMFDSSSVQFEWIRECHDYTLSFDY